MGNKEDLEDITPYTINLTFEDIIPEEIIEPILISFPNLTKRSSYEYILGTSLAHIFTSGSTTTSSPPGIYGLVIEIQLSMPPEYLADLINFLYEVSRIEPFSLIVPDGIDGLNPNTKLTKTISLPQFKTEYEQLHQSWQERINLLQFLEGDPAFINQHPDNISSATRRFYEFIYFGSLPQPLFLCPPNISIRVISQNGYLTFTLDGNISLTPVEKTAFFEKIRAMSLTTIQTIHIQPDEDLIILSGKHFKIPLKLIFIEDGYVLLTTMGPALNTPKSDVAHKYNQFIFEFMKDTLVEGVFSQIIEGVVEFSASLGLDIIEGIKFQQVSATDFYAYIKEQKRYLRKLNQLQDKSFYGHFVEDVIKDYKNR